MAEPEKKKRGRPKLSEEEKNRRKLERLGYVPPADPTPSPNGSSQKKGGIGGEKKDKLDGIYDSVMATDPRKRHKIDINDADAIYKAFYDYMDNCKENGVIASNVGFALWIGYTENMLGRIRRRSEGAEKSTEVVEALEYVHSCIEKIWVEGGAAGVIRDAMAIFVTSNKFGYRDTKHVEHHAEVDNRLGSADYKSLEDKYSNEQLFIEAEYEVIENENSAESDSADSMPDAL
jgi:hypothetical protein